MYDLLVIGGGPGGYNAAERAAAKGLKTCVVEKRALGGVCLNEGCIPTKTLLYSAKIYDYAKHSKDYGVTFEGAKLDHAAIIERKNKVVKTLVSGVGAKMKAGKIDVVYETAAILGREGDAFRVQAGDQVLEAKRLLIAAGSEPTLPPIDGLYDSLANGFAMTNREILDMKEVPKKLAVVGGGVIGLEITSYFNSIGTEVTVLEMLDHIAGPTEREISEMLKKEYASRGVNFLLGAQVTSIKDGKVSYKMNGEDKAVEADKVLVSIGRRASTKGLGLENIGVLTERGAVVTDEFCKTNVPGVWACGDVNGKIMLAHTAYREGEVAVDNMTGGHDRVNYNSIPSVIYTNPEVASVGETTESAKAKNLDVSIKTLTLRYSGRYIAENEGGKGILKVVLDNQHNKVLGVHIYGTYASEIIYGAAMMVDREMRTSDIQKFVFPHPTVCEVLREAIF
ncbi:MAG: dihydrolipoyl dehydrogenase [Lachnospiraceae bacterium]|nr:dihydrolipoyl dehydrogenase [Lachnospiraceae bacterium]MBR4768567.1 dihydrolipoyl dehydrogenase [Lachnospiraceae bacterium]